MYQYDNFDRQLVQERVADYREQTERYLAGELDEEQFKPLRLMNGVYLQRFAPMLRVAIPYGVLSSNQLRMLASIARRYDRDYGHFTTRQNIQYNWPAIERIPDILADLASVDMHAIQTSGNCIRNITSDHLAGVATDEIADPRPYCELLRQWSTLHPEFAYLPRKFKIAVTGAWRDRAAIEVHDIGLRLIKNDAGKLGFEVLVGGGLGRTPVIGKVLRAFLPRKHLLSYVQAIMRILQPGGTTRQQIQGAYKNSRERTRHRRISPPGRNRMAGHPGTRGTTQTVRNRRAQRAFQAPAYRALVDTDRFNNQNATDDVFAKWLSFNTTAHKQPGYRAVFVSLKAPDVPPGDMTAEQMDAVAYLADRYSFGLIRTSHDQNLLLADVAVDNLHALWKSLGRLGPRDPEHRHFD